ncbi:hypothetical protein [Archangium sp.]|uniref:hypothetical protein n=1 Tax=Archangium sp. TaxID=1872627 RepID=UPI002D67A4C3|nr:hypothetical protein [Archangium sp.]HYO53151.1 hypothetical protein [Archangium sp.]
MEQRNGRIDRKQQPSPEVRCHYFVYAQRTEDRVLEALVRKTAIVQRELGSLSPVVEKRLARLLERGIRRSEAEQLAQAISAETAGDPRRTAVVVEEELEATRERKEKLARQLDVLRNLLQKSQQTLGLDAAHFRDAVSQGLELLRAPRGGLDPSWAETLDTLRPPRRRDQKLWEWRKEAPIRPVIFSDAGKLDGEGPGRGMLPRPV